jgi:hypothetical protein
MNASVWLLVMTIQAGVNSSGQPLVMDKMLNYYKTSEECQMHLAKLPSVSYARFVCVEEKHNG